jgi:hypothetical protein
MRTLEKRCEMRTAVRRAQLLEALEHLELGPGVQGGGGLIQHQQLRVAHVRPRDGDLLPLAAGQVHAGTEPLAHHLVVAVRQPAITSSARLRRAASSMRARSPAASILPTDMFSPAVMW